MSRNLETRIRPGFLEGMRGLAAWAVVFNHTLNAFLPALTQAQPANELPIPSGSGLYNLLFSPAYLAISGHFAVLLFFVHSGAVLSFKYFARDGDIEYLVSAAVRRYLRLALPALGSITIAYLLLRAGLLHTVDTAWITRSLWLNSHYAFSPSAWGALKQGLFDIYFGSVRADHSYNSSLWTIGTELLGSYLVFSFLALFGRLAKRPLFYAALALIFFRTDYLSFVLGMIICDLYVACHKSKLRIPAWAPWLALGLGLYLAGMRTGGQDMPIYRPLAPLFAPKLLPAIQALGASLVVSALLWQEDLQALLNRRLFQFLGRISYSVYLIHLPILCSLGTGLYLRFKYQTQWEPHTCKGVAALAVLVTTLLLAVPYRRYVDEPSIELGRRFKDWLFESGSPLLVRAGIYRKQRPNSAKS